MKKKKWVHFRNQLTMRILKMIMKPAMFFKCGFRYQKIKNLKKPSLILYNHTTGYDQFFVGLMANTKTYFVMSDDLTTIPKVSKIIKFLVNPIPYKKASTDFSILKNCKVVANEGGSIAISPEGNRSFSGKTGYINPTISKMIRFLQLPVIFIHIEGGFGVYPRFSNKIRKGKCFGKVVKVLNYNDYKDLTNEQIYEIVKENIYTNDIGLGERYKSHKKAEFLERVIYNCPNCGITHFKSNKNIIECTSCHTKHIYNERLEFEGVNASPFFKDVYHWYLYQEQKLKEINYDLMDDIITTDIISLYNVIPRRRKVLLAKNAKLFLYLDHYLIIDDNNSYNFNFLDIISAGVFGKNKINIFTKDMIYQIKSDDRFNAIKYVHFLYHYKNKKEGVKDEFLGL